MATPHNVLVVNCGSSSVKFAVIDAGSSELIAEGIAERLGTSAARFIAVHGDREQPTLALPATGGHVEAMAAIVDFVQQAELGATLVAVGHRVVHGGEDFAESVRIDARVRATLIAMQHLAPLHNPANVQGIDAARSAFPSLPHIAVFDTAFHQTMPPRAYRYALPAELYQQHGIRRYGFHGSSHRYVSAAAAAMLDKPLASTNLISVHLGNGCSLCAISGGVSVDTSMGLTPLEGLVMGTRCGDIDPSLPTFLITQLGYTQAQVDDVLNTQSGLLGLSGLSNDCRTLEEAAAEGNADAQLALDIFCYRLAKYVASYRVAVDPIDALVLTGGIGENSLGVRQQLLALLHPLGFSVDEAANRRCRFGEAGDISGPGSHPVLVIPTNEEAVIAADAARIAQA